MDKTGRLRRRTGRAQASAAAFARYRAAQQALDANAKRDIAAGVYDETGEFLRLNHEVKEALKQTPWWFRLWRKI